MLHVGIDPSLRSSGIVALDENGDLQFIKLIIIPNTVVDEDNIVSCGNELLFVLDHINSMDTIGSIGYERLSFGSISGSKDKLAGSFWYNRIVMRDFLKYNYEGMEVDYISVAQWRKYVITKEDRKASKEAGEKIDVKEKALEKVPEKIKEKLFGYLDEYGLKRKHVYDLADAYWIAEFKRKGLK